MTSIGSGAPSSSDWALMSTHLGGRILGSGSVSGLFGSVNFLPRRCGLAVIGPLHQLAQSARVQKPFRVNRNITINLPKHQTCVKESYTANLVRVLSLREQLKAYRDCVAT